jgi:hypothetical protein
VTVTLKNPHRLRRTIRAATALACLAAAVAGWIIWDRSHIYDDAVPGDVLVSSDGRTLTTPALWTDCEDQPRLVAHESAHTVSLVMERKRHANLPQETVCDGSNVRLLSTTLNKPVGARTISDTVSGSVIAPFDGSHLARPRYLPNGYTLLTDQAGGTSVTDPPYIRARTPAWTTTYERNPGQGGLTGTVSITQTIGKSPNVPGTPVSINGHSGRLQQDQVDDRSVTWYDGEFTFNVSWRSYQFFLTEAEFLKVAEQLVH